MGAVHPGWYGLYYNNAMFDEAGVDYPTEDQAHRTHPGSATITTGAAHGAAAPLTTVGLRPPSVSGGQPPPDQRAASRLGILRTAR